MCSTRSVSYFVTFLRLAYFIFYNVYFFCNSEITIFYFTGLFNGFLLRSFGYRKISLAGAIINTTGVILTSQADSFGFFLAAYGIVSCKYQNIRICRLFVCVEYNILFLSLTFFMCLALYKRHTRNIGILSYTVDQLKKLFVRNQNTSLPSDLSKNVGCDICTQYQSLRLGHITTF